MSNEFVPGAAYHGSAMTAYRQTLHPGSNSQTVKHRSAANDASLDTVVGASGEIALTLSHGYERPALIAASMLSDILHFEVRQGDPDPASSRLHLHVGSEPPKVAQDVPTLWIPPLDRRIGLRLRITTEPWARCPELTFQGLGWSAGAGPPPAAGASEEHLCSQRGTVWRLDAHLPELFAREVLQHGTADTDMRALLSAQVAMRAVLARILPLTERSGRALSLLTIDAEDQLRYFINRRGKCSNVRGTPDDDLQFAKSCRTIMDRCEAQGVKAIFMVTGDELHPSFRDAFGDPLIGLEDNRRVLDEMSARGHGVACHGFDHEWWLSKGQSAIAPMSSWEKLRYFAETSGDLRTLFGLAWFLVANAVPLVRARQGGKLAKPVAPFTIEEVREDLDQWMACTGQSPQRLFIRYPGYVRSPATLESLNDRFDAAIDSSDLYELDIDLPAYPYTLLSDAGGVLRRTRVMEVPCVWIDKLLRTAEPDRVSDGLERLERLASFPDSVLSFVTHTKVLGSTWGHCHVYLRNPTKGLALPAIRETWERFADFLAAHTLTCNQRDLESILYGGSA